MAKRLFWVILVIGGLFLSGCGKDAKKAIESAEKALVEAKQAEAEKYAPDEYKSAESLLTKARQEYDKQEFKKAKQDAISAEEKAKLARDKALARKKEEEEGVAGLGYNISSLSEEELLAKAIEEGKVVLKDVHFAFDRYDLSEEARRILTANAKWLEEHPKLKIQIEGHCDERGTEEYNMVLGQKRAKATRDYIVSLGIDPARISIISYGESIPLDPRHNEEAWAKNRRAHFVLLK